MSSAGGERALYLNACFDKGNFQASTVSAGCAQLSAVFAHVQKRSQASRCSHCVGVFGYKCVLIAQALLQLCNYFSPDGTDAASRLHLAHRCGRTRRYQFEDMASAINSTREGNRFALERHRSVQGLAQQRCHGVAECACPQDMERAEDEIHRLQTEESQGFPAARDEEDLKKRKAATGGLVRMCPVSHGGQAETSLGCPARTTRERAPAGEPREILRGGSSALGEVGAGCHSPAV